MSETSSLKNAEVRTTTFIQDIASLAAPILACAFFERAIRQTASFLFAANRATASESPATMLILFRPSSKMSHDPGWRLVRPLRFLSFVASVVLPPFLCRT